MKKALKILSHIVLTLLFLGYIAYQFRTDPIERLSGRQVTGPEVDYPADWSFSEVYSTIAVETRPGAPHSVTVICWIADGKLHIPARDGATKDWPSYVMEESRVRLKVGDKVYPASLRRVADADVAGLIAQGAYKYPGFAKAPGNVTADTWIFEVNPG